MDDSSIDNCCTQLKHDDVRMIILEDGPKGPAYARNRGAEVATGDILIFIDADITVHQDTLTHIEKGSHRTDLP